MKRLLQSFIFIITVSLLQGCYLGIQDAGWFTSMIDALIFTVGVATIPFGIGWIIIIVLVLAA